MFICYDLYPSKYSLSRVNEVAREGCRQLVLEAEQSGGPLNETLLNLKKMLDSPLVQYKMMPGELDLKFELKSHAVSGFSVFFADPISEPVGKTTFVLDGKEFSLEELPPHLKEEMMETQRLIDEKLKAMGAVPYTVESSLKGLMAAFVRAEENNKAVVIASEHGYSLYSLVGKFAEYSKGKQFPDVVLLLVTDNLSEPQLNTIARRLGTKPHLFSYK